MKLLILTQKVDKNDDVLGFFHGWIAEFAKHCEKVTVIALGEGEYDLPRNVKVLSLGKDKTADFRGLDDDKMGNKFDNHLEATRPSREGRLKYIFNFYRFIWQERKNYDTVFVHMNPEYVVLGGFLWKILHKKIGLWYTHKAVNFKLRIAEKLADIIFSASPESFRFSSQKLKITGHGIDIERFKNDDLRFKNELFSEKRPIKIVTIGRTSPIKDYETLIKAAEILVRNNFDLMVNIIGGPVANGDEDYLEKLKKIIAEKKLNGIVNFVGAIPHKDIITHFQQADLFVNTSQTGSLDKAILEAMSCGLLVLSSNDSSKKVFGEYQDKLFFKQQDSLDLARKILKISNLSEEEKEKIGLTLRQEIKNKHNLKNLIKKIIFLYQ